MLFHGGCRRCLAVPGGTWRYLAATLGQMALQCSGGVLQERQRARVRLCASPAVRLFPGQLPLRLLDPASDVPGKPSSIFVVSLRADVDFKFT